MELWDRISTKLLQSRKLSLIDDACKMGMKLRILWPLLEGRSWFGQWGYEIVGDTDSLVASIRAKRVDEFLGKLTRLEQEKVRAIIAHYQLPDHAPLLLCEVMRQIFLRTIVPPVQDVALAGVQDVAAHDAPPASPNLICEDSSSESSVRDNPVYNLLSDSSASHGSGSGSEVEMGKIFSHYLTKFYLALGLRGLI